jgi:rhamnosyltransferase
MPKNTKIFAVIVTYHPGTDQLIHLIRALSNQIDRAIIVDNTPKADRGASMVEILSQQCDHPSFIISYLGLDDNLGIGYAQNIGIEQSIAEGANYVLLLDQDSVPSPNLAPHLMECLLSSRKTLSKIIAASPRYRDPRTGFSSLFLVSRFRIPYRYQPNQQVVPENIIVASFLISSGTLIDLKKLQELRGMRSDYFIDHVDTEWCLRAQSQGYKLIGVHDALMEHSLGEKPRKFWFFGMRNVSEHTPLRDYYMFRNTLLMLGDVKMPFTWKVFLLFRLVEFFVFFLALSKERILRFRMMVLGLSHGYKNIRGRLNTQTLLCDPIPKTALDPSK